MYGDGRFPPYVSVADRRKKAKKVAEQMSKRGKKLSPVTIDGRAIATTFWGKAWCDHLESYSDFENRLPRGRTYVRNGSVIHLAIEKGTIEALVNGSSLYKVTITVKNVDAPRWKKILADCSGEINSLIDLLQGKLSANVMKTITHKQEGLFPHPTAISFDCSCPDSAYMCKHVAAVLYGIGSRLDHEPELLFKLRQVDHLDLINNAVSAGRPSGAGVRAAQIRDEDLSSLFGIEIEGAAAPAPVPRAKEKAAVGKKGAGRKIGVDGEKGAGGKSAKKKVKRVARGSGGRK